MQAACHGLGKNVQDVSSLHTGQDSYAVQRLTFLSFKTMIFWID